MPMQPDLIAEMTDDDKAHSEAALLAAASQNNVVGVLKMDVNGHIRVYSKFNPASATKGANAWSADAGAYYTADDPVPASLNLTYEVATQRLTLDFLAAEFRGAPGANITVREHANSTLTIRFVADTQGEPPHSPYWIGKGSWISVRA